MVLIFFVTYQVLADEPAHRPDSRVPEAAVAIEVDGAAVVTGGGLGENAQINFKEPRKLSELDRCWWGPDQAQKSFAETVQSMTEYFAAKRMDPLQGIDSSFKLAFGIPLVQERAERSLADLRMCDNFELKDLKQMLGSRSKIHKMSGRDQEATLFRINKFSREFNQSQGPEGKARVFSRLMGCIAERESLRGDPGKKWSSYGSGVLVANDNGNLVGGIFQFSMRRQRSNWHQCLKAWNQMVDSHPSAGESCKRDMNRDSLESMVASSGQALNAFCGVFKLMENFAVQSYTQDKDKTAPVNISQRFAGSPKTPGGLRDRLQPSTLRCVTPFSSKSYQHFGPLRGTTHDNLRDLAACLVPEAPPVSSKPEERGQEENTKVAKAEDSPDAKDAHGLVDHMTASPKERAANTAEFLKLAVLGFGCSDYQSRMSAFVASKPPFLNERLMLRELLGAIKGRCKSDARCIEFMTKSLEPVVRDVAGLSKDRGLESLADAHKVARSRSYRCRY